MSIFSATTIVALAIICFVNAQEPLSPTFLVQRGGEVIKNFELIGKDGSAPVTYLVNYNDRNYTQLVSNISPTSIPVVLGAQESVIPFNVSSYYSALKTKTFGRNLLVGNNIPTTMDVGYNFGNYPGMVIVANMQTSGIGSNETVWVSPKGDVYMNINLQLKNPNLAGLLPIHCGLSLIRAVLSTPSGDYSALPIKFSWPISTTWLPWNQKIGGVLVWPISSPNKPKQFLYTSGCGIRVNSDIAYSVSKIIDEHNAANPNNAQLQQLDLPSLIARAVNYFEEYYNMLQANPEAFIKEVLKYWANDQQQVILNVQTQIVGLKSDGTAVLDDGNGLVSYLAPNPSRFGFSPINFVN